MVISSFISSILVLALGIWAYMRLESSMNLFAEKQLLIEPTRFSYKMWKDMPVSMYQSFTFFNLTNWNQVKSIGQKPRFVEVGPYVYKTIWSKSDINFFDDDKQVSFAERKQWHFQAHLSRGHEDDMIWTINTPLMTALALIQNAPVITRNIVSVILDGLGEGAFIRRPIRSLLFEGYSDLIVSVGPLFDRRFANFNGKFAYLYNKNDTIDGHWTVSTGVEDLANLNKINRFQSSIVNMTSFSSGQLPQGLNEVKPECAPAWSLDQSTNGQLFAPFNRDIEQLKLQQQLQQIKSRAAKASGDQLLTNAASSASASNSQHISTSASNHRPGIESTIVQAPKRFFSRISGVGSSNSGSSNNNAASSLAQPATSALSQQHEHYLNQQQQLSVQDKLQHLRDFGKFIFYPDLCRPLHLLPSKQLVTSDNGIEASRFYIDPRVFMNSSQVPSNKCFEMNPRPPLANALAATINSVTGANVNVPSLVPSGSSPFALFIPPNHHHHHHHHSHGLFGGQHEQHPSSGLGAGLFERSNLPSGASFLNNALHSLSATANQAADQLTASASNNHNANSPIGRLSRVRQLFSNIVSQRMSGAGPLLPNLSASPASLLMGTNHNNPNQQHNNHNFAGVMSPNFLSARNMNTDQHSQGQPPHHHHHHHHSQNQNLLNHQAALNPSSSQFLPSESVTSNNSDAALDDQMSQAGAAASGAMTANGAQLPANLNAHSHIDMLPPPAPSNPLQPMGGSDRWITQFRFKWPRGVFSIGQCQLGAPIYVSLPHFLDADEYYLEQVDGLRPNRSLHEFYIDVESTLHSVPVGTKARLQLNVATPELRFRNIPNAMIPVLWQEVTFKIDKPVATLLYWSFTMSSVIYKTIGLLMIAAGTGLLMFSLVSTIRRQTRQQTRVTSLVQDRLSGSRHSTDGMSSASSASCASSRRISDSSYSRRLSSPSLQNRRLGSQEQQVETSDKLKRFVPARAIEGQRSSWQRVLLANGAKNSTNIINANAKDESIMAMSRHHEQGNMGVTNRAFVPYNELVVDDGLFGGRQSLRSSEDGTPASSGCHSANESTINGHQRCATGRFTSPKQPNDWSRASSHCELVPTFRLPTISGCTTHLATSLTKQGTGAMPSIVVDAANCGANCLFTCLRHARTCSGGVQHPSAQLHNVIQEQQQQPSESLTTTTSDIDTTKTTLSSTRSLSNSVGSCSSIIYSPKKSRTFHKSWRASR